MNSDRTHTSALRANQPMIYLLLLALLGLGLSAARLNAQVILNPNQIYGTIQFTNTKPAILSLLNAPGNLGLTGGTVAANSLPPALAFLDVAYFTASSATNATYQVTVDSSPSGIAYAVSAVANLQPDGDTYLFRAVNSALVFSNGLPVSADVRESLTMLDVRFVTGAGVPVPVTSGRLGAYFTGLPLNATSQQAVAPQIAPGATNRYFAVTGGTNLNLDVQLFLGTNSPYAGFELEILTNVTTLSDQLMVVYCVVPDTNTLGQIAGDVSLGGEFLEHASVEAAYGPFGNERVYNLPGSNFTVPSSGPFLLTNLLPSNITTPASGYDLYVEMELRTNLQYVYFVAPVLGMANPRVTVPAGGSANLSNIFDITPGYFDGQITLLGPAETDQTNSILRGVTRFIETSPSPDGIPAGAPNGPNLVGNYDSYLVFAGVGRLATGATRYTALGGNSQASFPGAFNPASSAFEGSYETVAGGLGGENSVWRFNGLNLLMQNQTSSDEASYYNEALDLLDSRTNDTEVAGGQHYTNDLGYCFGEVSVRFRSSSGRFFQPRVVLGSAPGTFTNVDFQGHTANYEAYALTAYGTPVVEVEATNTGLVRLLLPQGAYTLYPRASVLNTNGGYDDTGLPPISLTVGCQQRILIDQCLQLNLDLPACANGNPYLVAGTVTSCTNVVNITWQLDGGPTNTVCSNCGVSPTFNFPLTLPPGVCSNHTLVVTAQDAGGEVSSSTSQFAFNNVAPVINCPSNMVVQAPTASGIQVWFAPTATANCSGPVSVICSPPSGSLFPVGTSTVLCYALDGCGNTNFCSFVVAVLGPQAAWLPVAGSDGDWRGVASSADGSNLVAVGDIYISTSTDAGATFGAAHGPTAGWAAVASSWDGNQLAAAPSVAADGNGSPAPIYGSTDAGGTWNALGSAYSHWTAIASSGDGAKLAASVAAPLLSQPDWIYTSPDSGATWSLSGAPSAIWTALASSGDGSKLAAASLGLIYTSTDGGAHWMPRTAPNTNWSSIACSVDGTRLVAAVGGPAASPGLIYLSPDSGASWTPSLAPGQNWMAVASSADGGRLYAVAGGVYATGPIYSSADFGATWVSNSAPVTNWTSVATSADGSRAVAVADPGGIYVWRPPTTEPPRLSISLTPSNAVLVSWLRPATGFVLQQSPTLAPTSWSNVVQTPVDSGTTRSVLVNPPTGARFYRLRYP